MQEAMSTRAFWNDWFEEMERSRPWCLEARDDPKLLASCEPTLRLRWWGEHVVPVDFGLGKTPGDAAEEAIFEKLSELDLQPRMAAWITIRPIQRLVSTGWVRVLRLLVGWLERRSDFWTKSAWEEEPVDPSHRLQWNSDRAYVELTRRDSSKWTEGQSTWKRLRNSPKDFYLGETYPMQFHADAVPLRIAEVERHCKNAVNLFGRFSHWMDRPEGFEVALRLLVASEPIWLSCEETSFLEYSFRSQVRMIAHFPSGSEWMTHRYTYYHVFLDASLFDRTVYHTARSTCVRCPSRPREEQGTPPLEGSVDLALSRAVLIRRNRLRGVFFAISRLVQLRRRNQFLKPPNGRWFVAASGRFGNYRTSQQ